MLATASNHKDFQLFVIPGLSTRGCFKEEYDFFQHSNETPNKTVIQQIINCCGNSQVDVFCHARDWKLAVVKNGRGHCRGGKLVLVTVAKTSDRWEVKEEPRVTD